MVDGKKRVKVTDFLSFYALPSHVMNNPKHNMLYVAIYLSRLAILSSILQPLSLMKNSLKMH